MPMLELGRVALGQPGLDPHLVAELHQPDAVGRNVSTVSPLA